MLTFDDIRILPQPTEIRSRSECNTEVQLGPYTLSVPVIVASMHSLVTMRMVSHIEGAGSIVVQPREMTYRNANHMALSTGLESAMVRAADLDGKGVLSLEIANGYQDRIIDVARLIKTTYPDIFLMAGTVCDFEGYTQLVKYGQVDAVLMGIGVGNACTTTVNTGVGLPAAEMLARMRNYVADTPIVLCGGVRTYGDVVKAIAMGADVVMSGYLFKDCMDTGERYYGEASQHHKDELEYIEGTEVMVNKVAKTSYDVIQEIQDALRSAMSYSDARTIDEFRARVKLVI